MSDTDPTVDTDDESFEVFPSDSNSDLRPGADPCFKCSTCDTSCPVAAVDDSFPGPKFQGPEQWRLNRRDDTTIDDSIMQCSNCMRCDQTCPADVPLSQMHNTLRAEYVDEQLGRFSRKYWRNKLLANYGRLADIASRFPRVSNVITELAATKWLGKRLFGITSQREFPEFATQTFRAWWADRGGPQINNEDKRIAYFHGDYADHNTPEIGKALVRVYESYGYEVRVPEQRCSGTPMFANGMLEDARQAARVNVETFAELVDEGFDVVCSCTSCSMALRQEYPELFNIPGTETVATNTYDAIEYLRIHEPLHRDLKETTVDGESLVYHAPCHARNQGLGRQARELFRHLDGVSVTDVGDSCSGISGTYGWKAENYDTSMAIGEDMFDHMRAADGTTGLTECPTCAAQMEHGTGYEIRHPLQILERALVE